LRPTIATAAPSDASSCAVQRPIPEPPPVTTTTLPANRPGTKTERYEAMISDTFGFNQALAWCLVQQCARAIIACQLEGAPMANAMIFEAVRTPRGKGKKDGSLHEVKPSTCSLDC
jgi:hypothetical protein